MRQAWAVALVVALAAACVGPASAQIPYIQVYFDADEFGEGYTETQTMCLSKQSVSNLYVVAQNWNMFVQAFEYQVQFPLAVFYLGETPNLMPNDLTIGNSEQGMSIAYNLPQNGFAPMLLSTLTVIGTSFCDCNGNSGPYAIRVVGEPRGLPTNPRAVRWPDFALVTGFGITSLVCPDPWATSQSTWGAVKALYR